MSVNTKMTAIADPIRTLTGTSGALTLDQMASLLTGANSEATSQTDLIAQIMAAVEGKAAGGGGGEAKVVRGSFTPSSNLYEKIIEHDLGSIPALFVLYKEKPSASNDAILSMDYDFINKVAKWRKYFATQSRVDTSSLTIGEDGLTTLYMYNITDNALTCGGDGTYFFQSGQKYNWFVAGM